MFFCLKLIKNINYQLRDDRCNNYLETKGEKMIKKGLIIADCSKEETHDFLKGLNDNSNINWKVKNLVCNGKRNFLTEVKRFFFYAYGGFYCFLFRNKYDYIICWQQFFGVFFSFFSKISFVKKRKAKVMLMTLIYSYKLGFLGRVYNRFMKFCLCNNMLDFITVTSSYEIKKYKNMFLIDENKLFFLPWSRSSYGLNFNTAKGDYIISIGRSNRDFDFVEDTLFDYDMKTFIFTDLDTNQNRGNCIYSNDLKNANAYMAKAFCVIIALKDLTMSSGQTLLISAFCLGKPVIVTKSAGLTDDYCINGVNSLVIDKSKDELINAINFLRNDKNYKNISANAFSCWKNNYTIYQMGINVAKILNIQQTN